MELCDKARQGTSQYVGDGPSRTFMTLTSPSEAPTSSSKLHSTHYPGGNIWTSEMVMGASEGVMRPQRM